MFFLSKKTHWTKLTHGNCCEAAGGWGKQKKQDIKISISNKYRCLYTVAQSDTDENQDLRCVKAAHYLCQGDINSWWHRTLYNNIQFLENQDPVVKLTQSHYCLWGDYSFGLLSTQKPIYVNIYIFYLHSPPCCLLKIEK